MQPEKNKFIITPWEVEGDIDYKRLIKEFGLKDMSELKNIPSILDEDILFRRRTIFAHRDFDKIIKAISEKKTYCMMTGLMPTGKFHIGHMILAKQMILHQKLGAKIYIAVADVEAYNARGQSYKESYKKAIDEYITNYIALGLKKENCEIYFQSNRSKDAKKSNAYYRLQNTLSKHATFNEFKAVYGEISPGKMISSLLQAADMLHPMLEEFEGKIPVVIPVGTDQDPHIRLARNISQRVKIKTFEQLSSTYHLFVPGLKGGKMSSSDPSSFVALTDDANIIKKKVNKYAFSGGRKTLEEHRRLGGNPEIDISFQWLKFLEDDDKKLEKIYDEYKSGKMLSGELKGILIEKLNEILKTHQDKKIKAYDKIDNYIS